jgi:hypothetical protein
MLRRKQERHGLFLPHGGAGLIMREAFFDDVAAEIERERAADDEPEP